MVPRNSMVAWCSFRTRRQKRDQAPADCIASFVFVFFSLDPFCFPSSPQNVDAALSAHLDTGSYEFTDAGTVSAADRLTAAHFRHIIYMRIVYLVRITACVLMLLAKTVLKIYFLSTGKNCRIYIYHGIYFASSKTVNFFFSEPFFFFF